MAEDNDTDDGMPTSVSMTGVSGLPPYQTERKSKRTGKDKWNKLSKQVQAGAKKFGQATIKGSKILVRKGVKAGRGVAKTIREEMAYQKQLGLAEKEEYRTAKLQYAGKFGEAAAQMEYQRQMVKARQEPQGINFFPRQEESRSRGISSMPIFEVTRPALPERKQGISLFGSNKKQGMSIFEFKQQPSRKKLKKVRGLTLW